MAYLIDPNRPQRVANSLEKCAEELGQAQEFYAEKAAAFGYAKTAVKQAAANVSHNAVDSAQLVLTEASVSNFRQFISEKESIIRQQSLDIESLAFNLATASSTVAVFRPESDFAFNLGPYISIATPPHWDDLNRIRFQSKLDELNPVLGSLARSIWKTYYIGTEESPRSSLLVIRQLYDHLFSILAPDANVQESPYFQLKKEGPEKNVHRRERLQYAAHKYIDDVTKRDYLLNNATSLLDLYGDTNVLHTRGTVDRAKVADCLRALEATLIQWVDAIGDQTLRELSKQSAD